MIQENSIFIAFDTETTGLSSLEGRVVEIAAVKFDFSGQVIEKYSELVNPRTAIPEDVIRVHHITDNMVAGKPDIGDVLPRFIEFIGEENNILIAQNAVFDIGFINHESLRKEIKLPRNTIIDQIDLTRVAFPDLSAYGLETVCRQFGIVDHQSHRAMADAVLVMKLFIHCLRTLAFPARALTVLNDINHYSFGGPMAVQIDETKLKLIKNALETGKMLEIIYSGGSLRGRSRRIQPLIMFNRDGIAYITARCLLSNADKQFRLDRIKECKIVEGG
jgi:DNA polymerase III epsilon subunit family exonuclease